MQLFDSRWFPTPQPLASTIRMIHWRQRMIIETADRDQHDADPFAETPLQETAIDSSGAQPIQ